MEFVIFFTVISLVGIFIFNIQTRWENRRMLCHLVITSNYYERILLMKKIISHEDVAETRKLIKDYLGEADFVKVRDAFLQYDQEYLQIVAGLNIDPKSKKGRNSKFKKLKELLYHKKQVEAMKLLAEINREKAKIGKKSQ